VDEFPDNSHKAREAGAPKEKNIQRIIEGKVTQRKKPLSRRFANLIVLGDPKSAMHYVLLSVLIPAAKDMLADAFQAGIDRTLYGEDRPPTRRNTSRSNTNPTYVSYNRFSTPASKPREEPRVNVRQSRSAHEIDLVILETRQEADEVLTQLFDCVESYASVSVADLYEMVGLEVNFNDHKWGWIDLRGSSVSRTRDGYQLNLPRPEAID